MKAFFIFLLFSFKMIAVPIVINTLPKSGSVYILHSLSNALQKPIIQMSDSGFPGSILPPKIISLSKAQGVSQAHLSASEWNINHLKKFAPKVVVHLRDPRQAMLSWLHHVEKAHLPSKKSSYLPNGYSYWNFSQRVDWFIDNHFATCIEWIKQWVDFSVNNQEIDLLFTTYEEFVSDRDAFWSRILSFYGYDLKRVNMQKLPEKKGFYHYRNGTVDEWREVLTREQQIRVTEMIPRDFFTRFNWVP